MTARFARHDVVQPHGAIRTLLLTSGGLSAMVLDSRSGASLRLDSASAAVWAYLDRPTSVEDLITGLVDTFGVDRPTATSTVDAALRSFFDNGLLDGSPDPLGVSDRGPFGAPPELPQVLARDPDP